MLAQICRCQYICDRPIDQYWWVILANWSTGCALMLTINKHQFPGLSLAAGLSCIFYSNDSNIKL